MTHLNTFNIDVYADKLLIILGDTLLNDNISNHLTHDFVGWHQVDDYKRWCLIKGDAYVDSFVDKPNEDPGTRKAVIGIYFFTDLHKLTKSLTTVIAEKNIKIKNEYQLSSVMEEYMQFRRFKAVEFKEWFDCGDLETYTKTRKNISRCFNQITVTDENTIIKKSDTQGLKIAKEALWYLNIPNKLRVHVPQLIDYNLEKGKEFYELEYVNFSPIHELFIYEMPHISDWEKILGNVFSMIGKFKQYSNKALYNVEAHATDTFITKTELRVRQLEESHTYFSLADSFTVNGKKLHGARVLLPKIMKFVKEQIVPSSKYNWQIIHGDLFFGNMLYDINSNTLKIVDPRGNFGVDGIYGDIRYDIAKLAHSIVGKYDFIVNGLYTVYSHSNSHIDYDIYESKQKHDELVNLFFNKITEAGYDKMEVMTITGLLFLTLIPLHSENPVNQKIFYAIALGILNDSFQTLIDNTDAV